MLDGQSVKCQHPMLEQPVGHGLRLRMMIPVLDVRDVEASIEFYCGVLGFALHDKVAWGGRTEWAVLQSADVQLMLCAGQGDDDEVNYSNDGVFFLYHDNLELLLTSLRSKGYTCRTGLLGGPRDFYVRDPDGYVLWFSHKPLAIAQGVNGKQPSGASD